MRYQRVRISTAFLMQLFTEGHVIHAKIVKGLPEDAKYCYSITGVTYGYIEFVFEHPSFAVVMMGNEIPLFPDIEVEKIYE